MKKKTIIAFIFLTFLNSQLQAGIMTLSIATVTFGLTLRSYLLQNKNTTKQQFEFEDKIYGWLEQKISNLTETTIEIDSIGVANPYTHWLSSNSDGVGILVHKKNVSKSDTLNLEYIWSHSLPKSERMLYAKDMFEKIKFIEEICRKNNVKVNFILNGQSHAGNLFLLIDEVNRKQNQKNRIKSPIILNTFGTPVQKTTKNIAQNQITFKQINHFYFKNDITQQLDCISDGIKPSGILYFLSSGKKGRPGSQANFINEPEDKQKYKNLKEFDVSDLVFLKNLNHMNFLDYKKDCEVIRKSLS